jgi:Zn-dependent protease/CBS domain-containing protein
MSAVAAMAAPRRNRAGTAQELRGVRVAWKWREENAMRGALRIGRVLGIEVALDWSWIFVFLLMTWNLTVLFNRWHPNWALGPSLFLAFVAALLFFASVLAHELAHAMVAMRFGMTVRQIRLFLFGGVSDIEREPPSPRVEILMAIAGPALSLGLGLFLSAIAGARLMRIPDVDLDPVAAIAQLTPFQTLVFWLGPVNVAIGLFNLIPGFPLDGGRVLRGIVWKITNDLHRATEIATRGGRFIGLVFILLGISMTLGLRVPYLGTGVGGLWLAFIGWFLRSAAERSFGALLTEEMLEGFRVTHLMRHHGEVLSPSLPLRSAINHTFMRSSEHAFPVVDAQGRLLGLLCVGDIRKIPNTEWDGTTVFDAMMPLVALTVVSPNEPVYEALRKLGRRDVDQLPVVEDGILVGMLTRGDIARWLELNVGAKRGGPGPGPLTPRAA